MVAAAPPRYPDYPFTSHYYDKRLHYLDEGAADAAPVVMLHGNPSWSFYYRKLVLALREDYRCIVPDHIGMGLSARPSRNDYRYTLAQRVDDLESLLEHLGVTTGLTLALHDWGGMIGMAYAARDPQRIKRLVISNTAAFHPPPGNAFPWQLRLARAPLLGRALCQGLNLFARGAARRCVARRPMSADVAAAYLAPYHSWASRVGVYEFVADIPTTPAAPARPLLDQVDKNLEQFSATPAMIVWGMRDFVFDAAFLAEWRKRLPKARVHCFEDAGHYLLEDAAEEVIPLVKRFLAERP